MAKILIPRSDSVDVKVIEPSDFEDMFSNDWMNNYVKSGFTLSAGSGLTVNIAVGLGRLNGLFINNSSSSSKGSLTANTTNYIYVTLARDSNSQAESWSFTSNTSGTTPADSMLLGLAITNGSSVTSVDDTSNVEKSAIKGIDEWGDGSDGNATLSSNTSLSEAKYYNNLTINSGVTVTGASPMIIFARGTVTINGTITPNRTDAPTSAGAGGAGGSVSNSSMANQLPYAGGQGGAGLVGTAGFKHNNPYGAGGGSGGHSGGAQPSQLVYSNGGSSGVQADIVDRIPSQLMTKIRTSIIANPNSSGGGGASGAGGGGGGGGQDSGGGGGNGGSGGAGGKGGGSVIIIAPTIIFNSGSSILSNGLAGTNGTYGNAGGSPYVQFRRGGGGGGGGGGNGGHGGSIIFMYKSLTDNGTTNITGGAGSTGGTGGAGGGGGTYSYLNAADGANGGNGTSGLTGTLIKLDVS